MTEALRAALPEILDYLLDLQREQAAPPAALDRLVPLRERHPQLTLELVWEEEAWSGTFHFDVLLRREGEGTVSLTYSPDRAVPWPLRHAHHARETQVARVNSTILSVETVMAYLDFIWNEARLLRRLVDVCLIQEEIERRRIEPTAAELQQALDAFRRENDLHGAGDTRRWLLEHGISHARLEEILRVEAATTRLREQVAAGKVDTWFEQRGGDFDRAWIARLRVDDEETARRRQHRIRSGKLDFWAAVEEEFLRDLSGNGGRCMAVVRRGELDPAQASLLFAAGEGEVVGPVPGGSGYEIVRVLRIAPARLDAPTREAITGLLFDEWLAARRAQATIEWHWGREEPEVARSGAAAG